MLFARIPRLVGLRGSIQVFLIALAVMVTPTADGRSVSKKGVSLGSRSVEFDRDWQFAYDPSSQLDERWADPGGREGDWVSIALPHTWSTYESTGDIHPFIKSASERVDPYWWLGWGWYRKSFEVNLDLTRWRAFIEFDGVQKVSRVYVNGRFIHQNLGGYSPFSVDITDAIEPGKSNVLAVAVSNKRTDPIGVAPMTAGNFNVYGGIYRSARLVIRPGVHIPFQGAAEHEGGQWIRTPQVSRTVASVKATTWIRNSTRHQQPVELKTQLWTPEGRLIRTASLSITLSAGELREVSQDLGEVRSPRLWSPDSPILYRVSTEVVGGDKVKDQISTAFGFRWFSWDKSKATLLLNDQPLTIRGMNRHQEYPWLGDAVPTWLHLEELRHMRQDMGVNFLRAGHYPNDPIVYDATDRLGIVTVVEVPNIKSIDFDRQTQRQMLAQMIRRLRNHPSILFWSVGNETDNPVDSCLARMMDPDRLIHARKANNAGHCVDHDHTDLDLESLLRVTIRGWATPASVPGGERRPLQSPDGQTASPEDWAHAMARVDGGSVRGRIDRPGVAWLYADHGADRTYANAPVDNINAKGFVDLYRVPKSIFGLWRANSLNKPVLHVHGTYWRREFLGKRKDIVVDSNCGVVELAVGHHKYGTREPKVEGQYSVVFSNVLVEDLPLVATCEGQGALRVSVPMAGEATRLMLSAHHHHLYADRRSIVILTADVVDERGNSVPGERPVLTWEVFGPARLVGASQYVSQISDQLSAEGTGYITTPVRNVLRTTSVPGVIRVRVTSPGLMAGEVELTSREAPSIDSSWMRHVHVHDTAISRPTKSPSYDRMSAVRDVTPMLSRMDNENIRFKETNPARLREALGHLLFERNRAATVSTPAFRVLMDELVSAVMRTDGWLIPDDFNLLSQRFNDAILLEGWLRASVLPAGFRLRLEQHYADQIIRRGRDPDYSRIKQAARDLKAQGRTALLDHPGPDGLRIEAGQTLGHVVRMAYPGSEPDAHQRLLRQIHFWNPHLFDRESLEVEQLLLKPARTGDVIFLPQD